MALPQMTPEQRTAALAKAAEARRAQSEVVAALREGRLTLAALLERTDDAASRLRLGRVLRALPGYGPARVASALEAAGIQETRRVGGLTAAQRERLLATTTS